MLLAYFCCCVGYLPFGGIVLGSLVSNTLHGPDLPWYVWALVFWLIVAVLGYLRVDFSAKVTAAVLFGELIVVFIYDVAILARGGAEGLSAAPFSPSNWFDGSFAIGLLLAAACSAATRSPCCSATRCATRPRRFPGQRMASSPAR